MSKELVISANRHETRVAMIEDDQVVEIFHQRENEYSLAGSIHKGRVTRVLPGMQSAFVDIGLERDAFLYVSDFFEDNEEYDKIVTGVEEKVLKLDRTGQPVSAAPEPSSASAAIPSDGSPVTPAAESITPEGAPAAAPPSFAPPQQHQGHSDQPRRDDRDSRGRRGRRRRGGKGRGGLPDSKFYSPGQRGGNDAPPMAPIPEAVPVPEAELVPSTASLSGGDAADFLVLPGESLAKYTAPVEESEGELEEVAAEFTEEVEIEIEEPEVEPEPPAPVVGPEPVAAPPKSVVEAEPEAIADAEPEVEEAIIEIAEPEAEPEPEVETFPITEAETVALEEEAGPGEESGEEADSAVSEDVPGGEAPEAAVDFEGPEPARIPTSLTATLREQGPRYQHRLSRRMRRKARGDRGDNRDTRGPAVGGVAEATRAPEVRQESRGEQRFGQGRTNPDPREKSNVPSISDLLKEGQEIIVQIAKEPLGQKGARITSHIALPGRFLVYMPTVDHIGVSRKIPGDDERLRLKRILQANRTGIPGGYIVRTAGDGRSEEELRADMMFLYNMWLDMRQKAERKPAPLLIHHDLNVVERILRDQLTSSFKSIWVDNEEIYESVLRFVQRFQPALVGRVKLYTRSTPIFDEFNITSELEKALRPKVWLKSGGYIVINQTEALVAIDINTGKYVGKSNRLEDTIVKTNTDAVKEIVRQIRLRDLGGIIVVDFIDMDERKNRQKVMQALEEAMRADRAPNKILQFNDFGLVAITRKRVKQSLERTLCVPCSYCEGAGYIKSPQTLVGEILTEAHKIARAVEGKDVMLRVAPEVAKLLKSNQNTYLQELEEILGRTVIVKSDPLLHQEKFDLA
jgi:ribonuclease G